MFFAARACRWRKQRVIFRLEISFLSNAATSERLHNIAGVLAVHIEPILSKWSWRFMKNSFTILNTSLIVVVVFSDWQYKKFSSIFLFFTYRTAAISWLPFDTSVDSSSYNETVTRFAVMSSITCSRISLLISLILLWIFLVVKTHTRT